MKTKNTQSTYRVFAVELDVEVVNRDESLCHHAPRLISVKRVEEFGGTRLLYNGSEGDK